MEELLYNPVFIVLFLAWLEVVLRIFRTGTDYSIINNAVLLLTKLFDLIPNRAKDLTERKSKFSVIVGKSGEKIINDVLEDRTLIGKIFSIFKRF